ncbi:MAG: SpoIVB peptidase [Clostridia bacterium]|nr:SpoIVB peptidase [Clostridia bacterium]
MKTRSNQGLRTAAVLLSGLLLFLPISRVQVQAKTVKEQVRTVLPGGDPFGVELQTKGVLVVGTSPVDCPGEDRSPAAEAGVKAGDILVAINGEEVSNAVGVTKMVEASDGKEITLSLTRRGEEKKLSLTPVRSESENAWKAGVWVRDHTAGIGTVTYYIPETGGFSGLGHGICDGDTGVLMPLSRGSVMQVRISSVRKGAKSAPGELRGYFSSAKVGSLLGNTRSGVFGVLTELPEYDEDDLLPIASVGEIREGAVTIRCTLDDSGVHEYAAKIVKLCGGDQNGKNFVLEVTDPVLLEKTGGIVQGMSGSPVIQNGKLVGAVTHVLLDDPARGYGILIENVLAKMPEMIG